MIFSLTIFLWNLYLKGSYFKVGEVLRIESFSSMYKLLIISIFGMKQCYMKRIVFILFYALCFSQLSVAQCSEPFFSEYIEGSGSNKALELFNPSDTAINLSDYRVYRFNNGATLPSDSMDYPNLWLASHDVYVIGNPAANITIMGQTDTVHSMTFYNGDDAIMLKKISTNDTLDIIGQIGQDPGSGWTVASGATNNNTLVRMPDIRQGQTNWSIGATEWNVFPIDMDDSLGTHNSFTPCYVFFSINPFACDSYLSPSGNYVWTTSGSYSDTTAGTFPFQLTDTVWTVNLFIGNCVAIYVDSSASGTNDGSSWTNAFTRLDTALNVALRGDTILVAQGTYYPTTGTDRTISFVLQDSVVMLGGYPSGGGIRDWENNQTVLSGDIGILNSISDNSYHVVRGNNLDSLCVLDGFYITEGKATSSYPDESGAGVYLNNASPTLAHLNIHHNEASGVGGGMLNQNSSPSLAYSVLAYNTASIGGAIYNSGHSFTMFKVHLVNNTANQEGGGMYNENSPAILKNVIFYQNAGAEGGGLYNLNSSANLKDVVFDDNSSFTLSGGGMYNQNSSPNLVQVIFLSNMATQSGGGMFNSSSSSPNLHQTLFAFNNVGLAYNGGAISGGSPTISNSIIAYDDIFSSGASISHSLVPSNYGGTNNIINFAPAPFFVDPLLVNPKGPDGIWMTADDGLRLKACAPMIDAGTNATLGPNDTLDINGDARIQGGTVDMGPYEGGKLPAQILNTANTTDIANTQITDVNGWTHYCNCDSNNINNSRWLLSLKKNGNNIGHIDSGMQVSVSTNNLYGTNMATDLSSAPYVTADTFFAMNRYWQVVPVTQPTTPVEVRFPYSNTDFTDLQGSQPQLMNHTDMAFFKIDSGYHPHSLTVPSTAYHDYANGASADTSTWVYTDYTSEIPNVHLAEYMVNNFSGGGGVFGNGTNNGPLPVRYLDFSVYKQATTDLLKWITLTETNNSHFNVQRSSNGIDFETLGRVNSKANSSTNAQGQYLQYSFVDEAPKRGSNYYRLEQVDHDGNKSYSKVIHILWTENSVVRLYPNPTKDLIHLDFSLKESRQMEVRLMDMCGRVIKSVYTKGVKGMNHVEVSLNDSANGLYHVQLFGNQITLFTAQVYKN